MTQKTSPFLEGKFGWDYGEDGWNPGMDENLLKFSYLFDKNINGIVSTLPVIVNGEAYFLTTDNRVYFAVDGVWYSSLTPKWFEFKDKNTGDTYQFNGTSVVTIDSPAELDTRLSDVETTINDLGSAAFENVDFFATQAELDVAEAQASAYTDALRDDLLEDTGSQNVVYKRTSIATTVARTLSGRLGDWVSIKDFGAIGDGSTNDTTAFQNAITAMNSGLFKSLWIPAGTYIVNGALSLTASGCAIAGDGMDVSIIKRTNGTFGDWITVASSSPTTVTYLGFTLKDITLYAEVDVTTGATLHMKNVQRVQIESVFIRNYHIGIRTAGIRDSNLDNIQMASNEFFTVARTGSCHFHFDFPADPAKKSTETNITGFNWTTAASGVNGLEDVEYGLKINGDMDGIWFNDGHLFGGSQAGLIIDATGVTDLSSPIFNNVWFDQYTQNNIIIQGTAATNFRFVEFNNCRIWGGLSQNVFIANTGNVADVWFKSCNIGVSLGQGLTLGRGNIKIISSVFSRLNQSATANGYAISVPTAGGTALVEVKDNIFDMSNLYYGIFCQRTGTEYHLTNNSFRNAGGSVIAEISYAGSSLTGQCKGNTTDRMVASDVTAATSVAQGNIVSDSINLNGATASMTTFTPTWHGRRVTFKADANTQNIASGGNFRNKTNAASVAIAAADMATYEFSTDSGRWHEL